MVRSRNEPQTQLGLYGQCQHVVGSEAGAVSDTQPETRVVE